MGGPNVHKSVDLNLGGGIFGLEEEGQGGAQF